MNLYIRLEAVLENYRCMPCKGMGLRTDILKKYNLIDGCIFCGGKGYFISTDMLIERLLNELQ